MNKSYVKQFRHRRLINPSVQFIRALFHFLKAWYAHIIMSFTQCSLLFGSFYISIKLNNLKLIRTHKQTKYTNDVSVRTLREIFVILNIRNDHTNAHNSEDKVESFVLIIYCTPWFHYFNILVWPGCYTLLNKFSNN